MHLSRRLTRALHEDHRATLALLERVEALLAGSSASAPPDATATQNARLLGDVAATVEVEIRNHFAFEEGELFPRLAATGDGDIGELLAEEHAAILPVGVRVAELARAARSSGFAPADWREFRRLGGELVERLVTHVQKEEMGLLPVVEELLDDEADARLSDAYAVSR